MSVAPTSPVHLLLLCLTTLALACGDDSTDGGQDGGDDGALDAGGDTGSPDAAADGEADAAPDTGGRDADMDATADAADGSSDGASADGGPPPWADCGTEFSFDDAWPFAASVTEDAVYCALFDEGRTLPEELALKAQLRVAPGSFRLPNDDATDHRLGLPICIRTVDGELSTASDAPLRQRHNTFGSETYHAYNVDFPTSVAPWVVQSTFNLSTQAGATTELRLDGSQPSPFDPPGFSFVHCDFGTGSCDFATMVRFASCTFDAYPLQTHSVTLVDDGQVVLDLRIGESPASTEPGAFIAAHGTFRGHAFDQRDYWKLVYRPDHHHFLRHFAVFFDAPIEGVCGLEIHNLAPFPDPAEESVHAIDCDFGRLEELAIEEITFTRES